MSAAKPILRLCRVNKHFNDVHALNNIDFELFTGEVHALLGENGAGKSTLIKVLTGVYSLDSGHIELGNNNIAPSSPAQAQALGVSTVYQEVNLLPNLSVAHNLFLGREPRRFGCIQWKKLHRDAQRILQRFKLDIDVSQSLSSYSIAIQQLIAITRGVDCSAKVLILDEPTASLDSREVQILFDILQALKQQGIAIIFITHFLDQVYAISDRITVLRNGERVGTFDADKLSKPQLIAHMLGRELQEIDSKNQSGQVEKETESSLQVMRLGNNDGLHDISFSADRGQTLGLAGLLGSGRTELCNTLFGIARKITGQIKISGNVADIKKPADAIKLELGYCPEDRRAEGIIGPLSIRENIIIGLQSNRGWWNRITFPEQKTITAEAIRELKIVCSDIEKPVAELSGGNQQKVILARWLCTGPKILILDEPTRGIDVGAHADIIQLIRQLCRQGMAVIVASSEIEELVAFSDKVVVMRDRTTVIELQEDDITEHNIVAAIADPQHQQALTG